MILKCIGSGSGGKEFERLKKCGIMVRTENQPSKVDFINNAVFQFPQDEDVEISNGLE